MVWDIFELTTQNKNLSFFLNGFNIMLSDWWKRAFKMASKDSQKHIAKKYKKHEIVQLL